MAKRLRIQLGTIFALVILLLCIGCSKNTAEEKVSDRIQKSEDKEYLYANSTDIFSVEENNICQYTLKGKERKRTGLKIKAGESFLVYADDSWLYYAGEDTEGFGWIGGLYRVPLGKGKDGRSVVAGKPQRIKKDLRMVSDYAVIGNYVVSIDSKALMTYNFYMGNGSGSGVGSIKVSLYNVENGKENKKEIPDALDEIENLEYENWYIRAQGENWVLWGGKALFLQMVPSGELIVLERDVTWQAGVWKEKDIVYYNVIGNTKKGTQSCWQYDIKKREKKKIITHKKYRQVLSKGLGISGEALDQYEVTGIWEKDGRIYIECETEYHTGGKKNKKRSLLLWNPEEKDSLYYPQNLNEQLHYLSEQKDNPDRSYFLGCVGDLWFFADQTKRRAWVYNEVTKEVKQLCDGGPEWHIVYALYPEGVIYY